MKFARIVFLVAGIYGLIVLLPLYFMESLFKEGLLPEASKFKSWNVTRDGIRINFDEGQVFGCSEGEQTVEIPFTEIKSMLSARALSNLRMSSVVGL